jgi:hypothetical protein
MELTTDVFCNFCFHEANMWSLIVTIALILCDLALAQQIAVFVRDPR